MDGVCQRLSVDSRLQHGPGIIGRQCLRLKRHLAQETQRRHQPGVNGRRLEVVEHLLRQGFVKGNRRDRGVGIGSKQALVES